MRERETEIEDRETKGERGERYKLKNTSKRESDKLSARARERERETQIIKGRERQRDKGHRSTK